ncbi:MAG: hypothetical protein MJZ82_05780 [Paludibacteraceae bacterium]|nr:hypothetical protein [Paludibacteraceae bacterium]
MPSAECYVTYLNNESELKVNEKDSHGQIRGVREMNCGENSRTPEGTEIQRISIDFIIWKHPKGSREFAGNSRKFPEVPDTINEGI